MNENPGCLWQPPPTRLTLPPNEVHVWRTSLDLPALHIEKLRSTLTPDELERAARFYFEKDQKRFTIGRGILRVLLGLYLNVEPSELRFSYTKHGKPALISGTDEKVLNFNLSHSHKVALYAMAWERELGVDVEHIRVNLEYEQIAEHFFSVQERGVLRTLPASIKPNGFFNAWTRKEAYIKARGEGLSYPLDCFDVSLAPGEPVTLNVRDEPEETIRWSIQSLDPGLGYAGALIAEGHTWQLACWEWSDKLLPK